MQTNNSCSGSVKIEVSQAFYAEVQWERFNAACPQWDVLLKKVLSETSNPESSLLPPQHKKNIVFSDCLPHVVEAEGKKTARPYIKVNAKKITKSLLPESLDVIMSLSVLDVLERRRIKEVAQGAFAALRSGGHFIVLNDRMIYAPSMLEKYATPENFASYSSEGDFKVNFLVKGVKYAPRDIVEKAIKNSVIWMPPFCRVFFDSFLKLNQLQLTMFLTTIWYEGCGDFFECLDAFFPPEHTVYVEREESYRQDMVESLTAAGFEIQYAGKINRGGYASSFKNEYNVAEYDMGIITYDSDSSLEIPPGQAVVYSNLQTIIGKKV